MKYDKDLAKKLLNGKFVSTIELYQENKSAIMGENIVCPNCREVFTKKNRQHTFCDTKCKDSFWDVMVDDRLNRKNIWNRK